MGAFIPPLPPTQQIPHLSQFPSRRDDTVRRPNRQRCPPNCGLRPRGHHCPRSDTRGRLFPGSPGHSIKPSLCPAGPGAEQPLHLQSPLNEIPRKGAGLGCWAGRWWQCQAVPRAPLSLALSNSGSPAPPQCPCLSFPQSAEEGREKHPGIAEPPSPGVSCPW